MASHALVSEMSDEEFERRTLEAIRHELGAGGLARFLMAFRSGKGDYTAERHQWLGHLTLEDIAREMGVELPAEPQTP
jgi:hypothetical protein